MIYIKANAKQKRNLRLNICTYWYVFNNLLISIYFIDLYRFYISQKLIDASSVTELK